MSNFIHLHLHSDYSPQDGAQSCTMIANKAKELGMDSVALTDHGRAGGMLQFKKSCEKAGVRPIYGTEAYLAPKDRFLKEKVDGFKPSYHLVLLAKNQEGLKNIFRLSSIGWRDGFYYKPRIDMEVLKKHSEGIVCLSGCGSGMLAQMLQEGRRDEAKAHAEELHDIFGNDLYIEVQNHGLDWQQPLKKKLFRLAEELGYPIVVTQDSHYQEQSDSDMHSAICKLAAGDLQFDSDQSYLKSEDEMKKMFEPDEWHAILRTQEVADKCNCNWEFGETIWPIFNLPDRMTPNDALRNNANEGFNKLFPKATKEYKERLEYELEIIKKMGFATYFLVVADFINWAKSNDIPVGPGRGSGAGSLVCYCIAITNVDPIKYGLYFERFLNPARISLPDIDVDFCPKGRKTVMQYVYDKYGKDKCAQIGTYAVFKPRGSLRDFARVLGHPINVGEQLAKLVPPDVSGKSLTFDDIIKDNKAILSTAYDDVVTIARRAEGLVSQAGVHAAGVVISDSELVAQVPLFKGKHDEIATQFDMHDVEEIGLVKYDFLGLKNLSVIHDTVELVKKYRDIDIDIDSIDEYDMEVFANVFQKGRLDGIFQFETSSGFRDLCIKIKPKSIEDLSAITALFRPGPLTAKENPIDPSSRTLVEKYVDGRNGGEITYLCPELEPILSDTYGVMCIAKNSMVMTKDGQKRIQDIEPGTEVITEDGSLRKVLAKYNNGQKETIRIRTNHGEDIICTKDHKILTSDGWKEASSINKDDLIKSFWTAKERKNKVNSYDWLVGLAIADGNTTASTINIACNSKEFAKEVCRIAEKDLGLENCKTFFNTRCWYASLGHNRNGFANHRRNPFNDILRKLKLKDKKYHKKRLPKEYSLDMIAGILEGDGCLINNTFHVSNRKLAYDVYQALQSFRINSRYKEEKDGSAIVSFNDAYRKIPFRIKKLSHIPSAEYVPRDEVNKHIEINYTGNRNKYKDKQERELVKNIKKSKCKYIKTRTAEKVGFFTNKKWSRVLSIENDTIKEVYDLSIETNHSFVSNGHVVHNCYQEQIMRICTDCAGYTLAEADNMRKIIGKKLPEKMALEKEKLVSGCISQGIDKAKAEELFTQIEGFAAYSFNKAHSVAYSVISYQTAWLKAHYPEEFYCALLNNSFKNQDDMVKYIHALQEDKIPIMSPDVNISDVGFTLSEGTIVFGLAGIKGMGEKACVSIVEKRPQEGFKSINELVDKKINKGSISALAMCGALEEISEYSREQIVGNIDELVTYYKKASKIKEREEKIAARLKEIEMWEKNPDGPKPRKLPSINDNQRPVFPDFESKSLSKRDKLQFEIKTLGFYLTGHPMDDYPGLSKMAEYNVRDIIDAKVKDREAFSIPVVVSTVTEKRTKKGQNMATLMVEDKSGRIETTVFPRQWPKLKDVLQEGSVYILKCSAKVEATEQAQSDEPLVDTPTMLVSLILNTAKKVDEDSDAMGMHLVELTLADGTTFKFAPQEEQNYSKWQQAIAFVNNVKRMGQ